MAGSAKSDNARPAEGASHQCSCKSKQPQPAIPADARDLRLPIPLAVAIGSHLPELTAPRSPIAALAGGSSASQPPLQTLLCRWLI